MCTVFSSVTKQLCQGNSWNGKWSDTPILLWLFVWEYLFYSQGLIRCSIRLLKAMALFDKYSNHQLFNISLDKVKCLEFLLKFEIRAKSNANPTTRAIKSPIIINVQQTVWTSVGNQFTVKRRDCRSTHHQWLPFTTYSAAKQHMYEAIWSALKLKVTLVEMSFLNWGSDLSREDTLNPVDD